MQRLIASFVLLPLLVACASVQDNGEKIAGGIGALTLANKASYLRPEYVAGVLVAYAVYDPLAPTWSMMVTFLDDERVRLDMQMRPLASGGDGEARQLFIRTARRLAEEEGFAGHEIVRYEEGLESTRPFARRVASGEIRLLRSQTWPGL